MSRVLLDTAIFVYAVGGEHALRAPCRQILTRAVSGELSAVASADLLQEFVHQRQRRLNDRREAVRQAREIPGTCDVVDLTVDDAMRALGLFAAHPRLDARDAVFAAVALERGIRHVLSPDGAYDAVDGLIRVDPLDRAAVDALCG